MRSAIPRICPIIISMLIAAACGCAKPDLTMLAIDESGAWASMDDGKLRLEIPFSGDGNIGSEWSMDRLQNLVDAIKSDGRINRLCLEGPSVTNDVINVVSALSHVQTLELESSAIDSDGVRTLCRFTELTSLDLSHCYKNLDDALGDLACLPNLREIDVTGIKLSSLRSIGRLKNLTSLVAGTLIVGVGKVPGREWRELCELQSLRKIILDADEIGEREVEVLTQLTKLEEVTIGCDRLPNPNCLVALCSLPALRTLKIFPPQKLPPEVLEAIRKQRPDIQASTHVWSSQE